jgi:hypothetical protein
MTFGKRILRVASLLVGCHMVIVHFIERYVLPLSQLILATPTIINMTKLEEDINEINEL